MKQLTGQLHEQEQTIRTFLAERGSRLVMLGAGALAARLGIDVALGAFFTRPDFWSARQLVDLGAEGLTLFTVVLVSASSLGYSWQAILRLLRSLFWLFIDHLRGLNRIPPSHLLLPTKAYQRLNLVVKIAFAQIAQQMAARRPILASQSRTPFLLFRQAALRVSP